MAWKTRIWVVLTAIVLFAYLLVVLMGSYGLNIVHATSSTNISSSDTTVTIEFFWGDGCPHCSNAKPFIEKLAKENPEVTLVTYEVYNNQENIDYMLKRAATAEVNRFGVPITFINDQYVLGYDADTTTGKEIYRIVKEELAEAEAAAAASAETTDPSTSTSTTISIPILHEINPESVSLPLLAIILGVVDGFNPCALWALVFLISLLLGTKSRKKLLLLGGLFIFTSGIVYFLFMTAWFNFFQWIGYISLVRLLVGFSAIAIAAFSLREWWVKREGGCEKVDNAKRSNLFERARKLVASNNILLAAIGIVVLSISVNLIEFMCSAGLPAVFTQVLSLNNLPTLEYYGLMLLYVLFFMIDDMVIFLAAVFTFKLIGIESKYGRLSRLIGGIALGIIGLLLILKPELLQFG